MFGSKTLSLFYIGKERSSRAPKEVVTFIIFSSSDTVTGDNFASNLSLSIIYFFYILCFIIKPVDNAVVMKDCMSHIIRSVTMK